MNATGSSSDSYRLYPFSKWTLLLMEIIRSLRERIIPLIVVHMARKTLFLHLEIPLKRTIFIAHERN